MIFNSSQKAVQLSKDIDNQESMIHLIAAYIDKARIAPELESAHEAAIRCIFDLLSAVCAGVIDPGATAVRDSALEIMGKGDFPFWFCGQSSSAIGAAWANSAMASIQDLDDGHRLARGHPGAAVIPTAFAIAQETHATTQQLLNAIVIGYEVGITIAAARKVYGNTGIWSSYAVVATAAALRGNSREVVEHALAIAGESAPNQTFASCAIRVPVPEGSHVKEGIPWSVVTGLAALNLAQSGHTGPRNILDSATHYHFEDISLSVSNLHIHNVYFKLYACCRHIHAPLDALLGVLEKHSIDITDITNIHVETYSGALRISNKSRPINLVDVQYSIPYCLAMAAVVGPESLLPLHEKILGNKKISKLAAKVTLSLNSELESHFPAETLARVTVTTADRSYVSDITSPRGEASNPLSWEELEEKFKATTQRLMTNNEKSCMLSAVNKLHEDDLVALMDCLKSLQ